MIRSLVPFKRNYKILSTKPTKLLNLPQRHQKANLNVKILSPLKHDSQPTPLSYNFLGVCPTLTLGSKHGVQFIGFEYEVPFIFSKSRSSRSDWMGFYTVRTTGRKKKLAVTQ